MVDRHVTPPAKCIVWILRKFGRTAVCRLLQHVFGQELRLEIDGLLLSSVVCRTEADIDDYQTAWRSALEDTGWMRLSLLYCRDCVNSVTMRRNLDAALATLNGCHYEVIDANALTEDDLLAGIPSPTLLWDGTDLFAGQPAAPGSS